VRRRVVLVACLVAGLGGCASFHADPLPLTPPLAARLGGLDATPPGAAAIDVDRPLGAAEVAALAVVNDPQLRAARTRRGVAAAQLFEVGLPPDPTVAGSYGALLAGPAVAPAISGTLGEDFSYLLTYRARTGAARARLAQANADILWQEWQVAAQAETLVVALDADRRMLQALGAERAVLRRVADDAQHAVSQGALSADQGSAALVALASAATAYDTAAEQRDADLAALDALLGLRSGVEVPLAAPAIGAISDEEVQALIAGLALRRPDLVALRFGYQATNADLRAAIIAQFPGITLGVTGGSDTSQVVTFGPAISLNLPIFNRNRGAIRVAEATRAQAKAQFEASLGQAEGQAEAALVALHTLGAERAVAAGAAARAEADAAGAARAYAARNIDGRTYADLIAAAASRRIELIALDQKLAAGRIALASLLGFGLPEVAPQTGGENS
jgi:outer membrane protein TolC